MSLLTVNAGSSSIRLKAFSPQTPRRTLAAGHYAGTGAAPAMLLREFLTTHSLRDVAIVGHRVVHGGEIPTGACPIDKGVEAEIERVAVFAPLHNPVALEWIRACRAVLGEDVVQVAVFDTAFYADLPDVASAYAIPRALARKHRVRRYGFHGIAHQAMWHRWCEHRPEQREQGKLISLQLGAGCSITAIDRGRPIDTSMGFSPLEGLVMATRSGDLDPGVVTFLQRAEGLRPEQMDDVLNRESGLRGLSGISADMRQLLDSAQPAARLAVDAYCYRARKYIGAYMAALGGADAIVFGGGVGEHAPAVRAAILAGLESLGIALDPDANRRAVGEEACISAERSATEVWVVPVDEADVIARTTLAIAGAQTQRSRT